MDTGIKIERMRKQAGLPRETLAEKLGVNEETVSQWENGTLSPSVETLEKICETFGTTPEEFFTERKESGKVLVYQTESSYEETVTQTKALNVFLVVAAVAFAAGFPLFFSRVVPLVIIGSLLLVAFLFSFAVSGVLFFFAKKYTRNITAISGVFLTLAAVFTIAVVLSVQVATQVLENFDFNAPAVPQIDVPSYYDITFTALNAINSVMMLFAFRMKSRVESEYVGKLIALYVTLVALETLFNFYSAGLSLICDIAGFYVLCFIAKDRTYSVRYTRYCRDIPAIQGLPDAEIQVKKRVKIKEILTALFSGKRLIALSALTVAVPLLFYPSDKPFNDITYIATMLFPLFAVKTLHAFLKKPETIRAFVAFAVSFALEYTLLGICACGVIHGWNLPVYAYLFVLAIGLFSFFSFSVGYSDSTAILPLKITLSVVVSLSAAYFAVCMLIPENFAYDIAMMQLSIFVWIEIAALIVYSYFKKSVTDKSLTA